MYAPNACHASDPPEAADVPVGSLHHLHAEQSEVVEPVKLELKTVLIRQLREDIVLDVSHRVSGQDVLRGINPQPIGNPSDPDQLLQKDIIVQLSLPGTLRPVVDQHEPVCIPAGFQDLNLLRRVDATQIHPTHPRSRQTAF